MPTVNPPGEALRGLRRRRSRAGWTRSATRPRSTRVPEADLAELAPLGDGLPRPNLIGTLNHGDGPVVHLNGHYDVVPVGNDWTRDPFGGELDDGWIYGRGAADMKSGLAAQVIAVEALRRTELGGHDRAERGARRGDRRRAQRRHGLAGRAGPGRGRRADHHRAVRPRRRRHRPQGRDLGRDHAARQAGARLLAAARRQRRRGDGALPDARSTATCARCSTRA